MARNPFSTMEAGGSDSAMNEMCGGMNLTRKQRFIGFGVCFVLGFVISFLSFVFIFAGDVVAYAIVYTFGNIISLIGTGFLSGFGSQIKGMFDQKRRIATSVFLLSMILTLVVAFTTKLGGLCLVFAFIQFCALFWYSISYIPFARDIIKKSVGINWQTYSPVAL